MDGQEDLELGMLVHRFDAGDRSPELMAQLNRVAFDCFHAPWEPLPCFEQSETLIPVPVTQGRLPLEPEDDEKDEGDTGTEGLDPDSGTKRMPSAPVHRVPMSSSASDHPGDPLDTLDKALEAMGRRGQLAKGHSLVVDLPFDTQADNQSRVAFRVHRESQCLQVISYGDLAISGVSELELERLCRAYNRRSTGMVAKTVHPHEGARIRLRLITSIPLDLTGSLPALVEHLGELFQKDRQFWRHIRRSLPI